MTDRMTDERVEQEIRRFLEWYADERAGAPTEEEMVRRIASQQRRARASGTRLVLAFALLGLLLTLSVGLVLTGAGAPRDSAVVSPSPATTAAAVATVTATPLPAATATLPRPFAGLLAVWGSGGGADGTGADEIRIIDPDGTAQRTLPSTGHDSYPVWSPDGSRIAYTAHDGRGPVRLVNADGTGARSVTEGYASPQPVAWSPDGRQLAFIGYRYPGGGPPGALYVVNADGTGLRRLVAPERRDLMRLGWAPDGSLISIVAVGPDERPGEAVVYVVDPRTGAATQVSDSPRPWREDDAAPSWSPDSSRLLYAIDRSDARAASGIALAERRRGGWTERIVVPNPLSAAALWLDSDHFVFLHAGTRLVVANADGSGQRELVRVEVPLRTSPCVAPDGSRVALALAPPPDPGGAVEGRELLVVAVDATTPPRRIPTGRIYPTGPGCSWQAVHP